jgi:N-methylhydantoinase B
MIEARYPLRVESAGLMPDSGGAGARRGGLGVYREYRLLMEGHLSSGVSCHEAGPAGGCGGRPGGPCRLTLIEGRKKPQALLPVASAHPFAPGSLLRVETPGGGGWGDPKERDPEAVRLDVLRGYVSPEAAREVFGVGLGEGLDFPHDPAATRKLRARKG